MKRTSVLLACAALYATPVWAESSVTLFGVAEAQVGRWRSVLAAPVSANNPLGAVLATEKAASGMVAGTHGSTYGGNPLGCAVGAKVLEIVSEDGFLAEVNRKGGLFRQGLESLVARHPKVYEAVRGQGLMLGLKCTATNTDVVKANYDQNLLTVAAADNVIRLLPALNIPDDDISEALARLDAAAATLG